MVLFMREELKQKIGVMSDLECKFKTRLGVCNEPKLSYSEYCSDHYNIKCSICNCPATHECEEPLTRCKAPLCDNGYCSASHKERYGEVWVIPFG